MIVRLEVTRFDGPSATYCQLKRCQVQRGWTMEDVSSPGLLRSIRFVTLDEAVRHAKKATFAYLEAKRHKKMPRQIDWCIVDESRIFPCPACHQPMYQKARLGRFGNTLDLQDWGCSWCKNTVTLNTASFLSINPPASPIAVQ